MNELIMIGKTISTFGIKGELKVFSDFEKIDRAFKVNRKILINNKEHIITSIRYHKNLILMGIDNIDNINNVLEYVGFNIYMAKSDLELKDNEYLYRDLIDAQVIDSDNTLLGVVKDVEKGSHNDFIKVAGTKDFLIPLIPEYIDKIDIDKKTIHTKMAKDLII